MHVQVRDVAGTPPASCDDIGLDTTPPVLSDLQATPDGPHVEVTWSASDPGSGIVRYDVSRFDLCISWNRLCLFQSVGFQAK